MSNQLPLGAHLVSPRFGYTHHGIYAGGGRVIHYAGLSSGWRRGPVEEVPLELFSCGRPVAVEDDTDARFPGPVRVDRARLRLGENRYSLWTNNCEHFCAWCLHGTSRSAQVEALRALRWFTAFAAKLAHYSCNAMRRMRNAVDTRLEFNDHGHHQRACPVGTLAPQPINSEEGNWP